MLIPTGIKDEQAIYIKDMKMSSTHIFVFWRKKNIEQITWPIIVFKVTIWLDFPSFFDTWLVLLLIFQVFPVSERKRTEVEKPDDKRTNPKTLQLI